MSFSRSHFSMLIRYIGISFITGAISHGFFSGGRQFATAAVGIIFFIIGSLLEEGSEKIDSWKVVLSGTILAIGIGAVTGGFQHFPDSPERSLWIIPVGYLISIVFYASIHKYPWNRKSYVYSISSFIAITLLCVGIFFWIENSEFSGHQHLETIEIEKNETHFQTENTDNLIPIMTNPDSHDSNTDHHN